MAENVAQLVINRGRSGTKSLRKGDLLPQPPFSGGGGNDGLRTTEKQLQDAQTTIQRMTSVMADMARMMHPGAGVPYDPAGAEPEGAQKQDGK